MKTRVIQNEPDQPAIEASTAPREPKQIWEVPVGQHIAGITTRPREYERRVIAFFDNALFDAK